MNTLFLSLMVGLGIGIIDIVPRIVQKLPRYSIAAAFLFFLFISVIIFHTDIPYVPWWVEGALISIAMMSPILIHVGAADKKPVPVIAGNAVVFGTLIGIARHYLIG